MNGHSIGHATWSLLGSARLYFVASPFSPGVEPGGTRQRGANMMRPVELK